MKPRASYNPRGRGRGRSKSQGRGGAGEEAKASTSTGLIAELPVLSWTGKQSNYADFKEMMSTYLQQQFGNNGDFIATDGYYEPIKPAANSSMKAVKRNQIQLTIYEYG